MQSFDFASTLPHPPERVFAWHERPGAIHRLLPPWLPARVERHDGIAPGDRAVLRLGWGPLSLRWVAEHGDYEAGRRFADTQVAGPFAAWTHVHETLPEGSGTRYRDTVRYALPPADLPTDVLGGIVREQLNRQFAYRHRIVAQDLALHARYGGERPLRIAVTGASGLIGSALTALLTTGGHEVLRLVRRAPRGDDEVYWSPRMGEIDAARLEGLDAVVHLAGENVFALRWTDEKRERILRSREQGTRLLAKTLAALDRPPAVLVSASAIGHYGDTGDEIVDESSPRGTGFLADVVARWEAAADPAREAGIRVVHPRIGIVLSPAGGALQLMLPAFRLGLGGHFTRPLWMSWVTLDDVVGALYHALATPAVDGPMNVAAPAPARMQTLAETLGDVLGRATPFVIPSGVVSALMGDAADETLLSSIRAHPAVLRESGYTFLYPELRAGLEHLLGQSLDARLAHLPDPAMP